MPVVSSKPYNAGDVVFRCKPLLFIVLNDFKGIHCDNCLKRSDQLMKCSKCLEMHYCGKDCQINDWKYHKNECKVFRHKMFHRSLFTEKHLLLLRLYLRVKYDPTFATQTHKLIDGSDVSLKDINVKDCGSGQTYKAYKAMITKICKQFKSIGIDLDVKDLRHWYALIVQNCSAFSYYSEDNIVFTQNIAASLVLEAIPIRHSCLPNAIHMTKGLSMEIRAKKSISTGDEITISYIPLFMDRMDRRLSLKSIGIDCNCSKCRLHLDKDIDYEEIKTLMVDNEIRFKCSEDFLFGLMMNVSYEMDTNFMLYLKSVLGDFHPIITLYLLKSFKCLSANWFDPSVTKSLLKLWYKEVESHLLITHGSDHPWYALLPNYKPK